MLRDLQTTDGKVPTRKDEIDPSDSVFLVLIWWDDTELGQKHFEVGSVFLSVGEAKAAAERYARDGHKSMGHVWQYCTVIEVQTGQLAPHMERHGEPIKRYSEEPSPLEDEKASLLLEINRLRAQLGQSQTTQIR